MMTPETGTTTAKSEADTMTRFSFVCSWKSDDRQRAVWIFDGKWMESRGMAVAGGLCGRGMTGPNKMLANRAIKHVP